MPFCSLVRCMISDRVSPTCRGIQRFSSLIAFPRTDLLDRADHSVLVIDDDDFAGIDEGSVAFGAGEVFAKDDVVQLVAALAAGDVAIHDVGHSLVLRWRGMFHWSSAARTSDASRAMAQLPPHVMMAPASSRCAGETRPVAVFSSIQ